MLSDAPIHISEFSQVHVFYSLQSTAHSIELVFYSLETYIYRVLGVYEFLVLSILGVPLIYLRLG